MIFILLRLGFSASFYANQHRNHTFVITIALIICILYNLFKVVIYLIFPYFHAPVTSLTAIYILRF